MQKGDDNNNIRLAAFGEFLLRLHSNGGQRFAQTNGYTAYYAGAEANVCVLLARLGIQASYITRIPGHDIAAAGVQQLRGHGVDTEKIIYGGDKLGLYFTEPGHQVRPTRVIYDREHSSFATLQKGMFNWTEILKDTQVFHWSGVAAALSASSAAVCEEALEAALDAGLIISSDFNYRSTLWKYGQHPAAVMPRLLQHSHITVADLDAAQVYFGIETDPEQPLEDRFRACYIALKERMPRLTTLGMSFRKQTDNRLIYTGALVKDDQFYFSRGFALPQITDQIGTGDAFTAGMLFGILQQYPPQEIIDFAVACGTLKQSIPGDWAIISRNEVTDLMKNGLSGRIVR
ncbi:sugar kinase [Chitinophaga solisilvae]|uniref:Sugar kinase n=1 Tax=Chitinophaga solisilvae TaxID=1233460 RepID=A0A3S1DSU2_9BACT|nr:sugar kinase [Chitinophaga solisilvae]NSL85369.1 sugar kinase [Chitinophaga solisilvae]